jgi:acetyl/propionyl-CoA carboxylase alpha subunit
LPAPGQIDHLRLPDGHGLRLEVGAYAGMRVSGAYDPLLLKIIAHGPTRTRALARLQAALQTLELCGSQGFASNQALLCQALQAPEVVAGGYHTCSLADIGPPAADPDPSLAPLLAQLARPERQPTLPNRGFWRPAWQRL